MTTFTVSSNAIEQSDAFVQPPTSQSKIAVASAVQTRWAIVLLGVMTLVQAVYLFSFYAPANGGTDQNGYHVTARLLAQGKGASFRPISPFSFVGNMMILTEDGRIYAKYPPGYPLLAAVARLIGGASAVYLVNPLCTVLACSFSYFFFRTLLSEFASLIAVLWLSWNPVILNYANDGNSHASTLLFVILGAWGLIRWLQHGSQWRGVVGGFCLGCAATIRYSENLFLLPILFAAVTQVFSACPPARSRIRESAAVLLAWAIPVGLLACFCWSAFGAPWRTGYSYCNEDTGFGWKYLIGDPGLHRLGNWETLLVQMNWMGLFMLWPLGVVGLFALVAARHREGILVACWTLPLILLYLCYYWAPSSEMTVSYLRFFVPVIPAFVLTALWLLDRAFANIPGGPIIPLGLLTSLGLSVNLWNVLPSVESSLLTRQALAQVTDFVHSHVPAGSSLFIADDNMSDCLDSAGGYNLYNLQLFRNSSFTTFDRILDDPAKIGQPDPRQRARLAAYWHLVGFDSATGDFIPKSNEELKTEQNKLLDQLLRSKAPIFFLLRTGENADFLPDPSRWQAVRIGSFASVPRVSSQISPIGGSIPRPVGNDDRPPSSVTWMVFKIRS